MTKQVVQCPICGLSLGRFHQNQSIRPLRDHTFRSHPDEYKDILILIEEIDDRYKLLKGYGVDHWSKSYYHKNPVFESELANTPPMSEEARQELVRKIKGQG